MLHRWTWMDHKQSYLRPRRSIVYWLHAALPPYLVASGSRLIEWKNPEPLVKLLSQSLVMFNDKGDTANNALRVVQDPIVGTVRSQNSGFSGSFAEGWFWSWVQLWIFSTKVWWWAQLPLQAVQPMSPGHSTRFVRQECYMGGGKSHQTSHWRGPWRRHAIHHTHDTRRKKTTEASVTLGNIAIRQAFLHILICQIMNISNFQRPLWENERWSSPRPGLQRV